MARLPILESAGKLSEWAGLYEVTPDAHPIIGPIKVLSGFYVVAGFSGHGFMHGPISGLLIAEQIVDGSAHSVDISSLAFERFSGASTFKEFNDAPERLPFDQNCLVALCAPRPVLFSNGEEDQWSNPAGQFEGLKAADPVYRLLGVGGSTSRMIRRISS